MEETLNCMKKVRYNGFTLIELMIALLVVGILLLVAAPAMVDLIRDNRMLSQVYAMRASLNKARSKALSERTFVTFCRSNDGANCGNPASVGWNEGYIAFTDDNGDGVVNDPNDPDGDSIVVSEIREVPSLTLTYRDTASLATDVARVRFNSQGYATGFDGTFSICDDRGDDEARGLIVSPVGSVRAAVVDPNDPGSDNLASCP